MNLKKMLSLKSFISIFSAFIIFPSIALAIENSECIQCHGEEGLYRSEGINLNSHNHSLQLYVDQLKFSRSVHNYNGITCVDCHSDIKELNYDEEVPHPKSLNPVACTNCHEEEGTAYLNSVHMQAQRKGITMRCYACHDYHSVTHQEASSLTERRDSMCLKCHNPSLSHDWLPQKNTHFDFVECTACHAPEVSHHIHLNLYDLVTNKFLKGTEILKTLSVEQDDFLPLLDTNHDDRLNSEEFENLVLILRQKSIHPVFHAELVAELHPAVHAISKEGAVRNCEKCHSQASPFFNAVTIILGKDDGRADHYEVDRAILEGYHISNFYALAGTRVRLLDKIGLALIAGGICVVMGHLLIRAVTIPVRRKKMTQTQAAEAKLEKQEVRYV